MPVLKLQLERAPLLLTRFPDGANLARCWLEQLRLYLESARTYTDQNGDVFIEYNEQESEHNFYRFIRTWMEDLIMHPVTKMANVVQAGLADPKDIRTETYGLVASAGEIRPREWFVPLYLTFENGQTLVKLRGFQLITHYAASGVH